MSCLTEPNFTCLHVIHVETQQFLSGWYLGRDFDTTVTESKYLPFSICASMVAERAILQ